MTKLSVNVNKFATLRNARGGNNPNLIQCVQRCQLHGAHGITVHPRPDERHIRYKDVFDILPYITTEFNIEGNPNSKQFIQLVLAAKPTQVTLVPDADNVLTSNAGWDTIKHKDFLSDIIAEFKSYNIRTSIFIDPLENLIEGAAEVKTDRVELYTESYANNFLSDRHNAVKNYIKAANLASKLGLGINAGHDLDLHNLNFFCASIPNLLEVSIGHALVCDALFAGLESTIKAYLSALKLK